MTRLHRLLLYGYLIVILGGFLGACAHPAFAESAEEWMGKGRADFQEATYEEAKTHYSRALEMEPNMVEKQEAWARERVKSRELADCWKAQG